MCLSKRRGWYPRLLVILISEVSLLLLMFHLLSNTSSDNAMSPQFFFRAKEELAQMVASSVPKTVVKPQGSPVTSGSLRKQESVKNTILADCYKFTINEPDVCHYLRPQVFTLIYVHTALSHFKHRTVIRQTFGSTSLYHKLRTVTLFFVGQTADKELEKSIRMESERYRDIIQGDYLDTYRNLSLKALSAMHWIHEYCSSAIYVLKVDDDVFVNVFNLVRHLNFLMKYEVDKGSHIHCKVFRRMGVIRNPHSKWYVTKNEFAKDIFPPFCSGSAFFMQRAVVSTLYNASRKAPFFWVDDVFITGVVAGIAGIGHNTISSIVVFKKEQYDAKLIRGEGVFGHMTGDKGVDLIQDYWKKVLLKEGMAA